MKRRAFVKQSSAMAAGSVLWACGGQTDSKNKEIVAEVDKPIETKRDLGIQLYTLRNELPNDKIGVLTKLSEIGFKYLETYMLNDQHHLGMPIKEYKSLLDDLGLEVVSSHITTGRTKPDVTGTLINNFEQTIEDTLFLGGKYLVCPYLEQSERQTLDDYKATVELLNKCGELCKEAGLQMAYHNHEFEFMELEGQIPMEMIIEETEKDILQIELDIYWSTYANRDAMELFSKYPGRFELWHVKDMSKTNREDTTFIGDGNINYENIFQNSGNSGMNYFFVEQEHYPIPVYDGLQKSIAYLQSMKA